MLFKFLETFKQEGSLKLASPYKGIVVDNADPLLLGRVKASIEGLLPDDVSNDVLPWIHPAATSGFGGRTDDGSFVVPEIAAEILVEFPYGTIYFPFYKGFWQSATTHPGAFNEDYPDSYGFTDPTGNVFRINKARQEAEAILSSGVSASVDADGNLIVSAKGKITFQSPNGDIKMVFDPATGKVQIEGTEESVINADILIDNQSITERTGTKTTEVSGDIVEFAGGGRKIQVGGDESKSIVNAKALTVGGNVSELIGGEESRTIGLGSETTVGLGDYTIETIVGGIELNSLLASLKIPLTGIAELDGILVRLAGGSQPVVPGVDWAQLYMAHIHPTGVGPSAPPTNAAMAISILSKKVLTG